MPDLEPPPPPVAQQALRRRLEQVLADMNITDHRHEDRFWESEDGREAVYGWGTVVRASPSNYPVHIWFDGLDHDIAISTDANGRWPRRRPGTWHEWLDLTQLDEVLDDVAATLRQLLTTTTTTTTTTGR